MAGNVNIHQELDLLLRLVVVEGTKIVGTFAALHGLHHTDVEALTRILLAEERGVPMTAGALAEELMLTSGAITFVVDRLERAGHITRVRDDTDRRKVLLHHSPGGRALANEFFEPRERQRDAALAQFTPEELEVVHRFLSVTVASMTTTRQSMTPPAAGSPARRGRTHRSSGR